MKIYVIGSLHHQLASDDREPFKKICREIGAALVKEGHTIIVGSDSPNTADRYIVEGAGSVKGRHNIIVYRPPRDQKATEFGETPLPFSESSELLRNLKIQYRHQSGRWPAAHTAGTRDADVLIMVGGGRGSELASQIAPIMGKPVLAIPLAGGAAKKCWEEFQNAFINCGITDHERECISILWQDASAAAVEEVAKKIYRKNPFRKSGNGPFMAICGGLALCIAIWSCIFFAGKNQLIDLYIAFFLLTMLSALIGTGLRITTSLPADQIYEVNPLKIAAEATSGVILSFGFMLLYFVGAFIITGDFKHLKGIDDFLRSAISLSVIALAAAYLLERSTKEIAKRLESTVFGKPTRQRR